MTCSVWLFEMFFCLFVCFSMFSTTKKQNKSHWLISNERPLHLSYPELNVQWDVLPGITALKCLTACFTFISTTVKGNESVKLLERPQNGCMKCHFTDLDDQFSFSESLCVLQRALYSRCYNKEGLRSYLIVAMKLWNKHWHFCQHIEREFLVWYPGRFISNEIRAYLMSTLEDMTFALTLIRSLILAFCWECE